MHGNGRRFASTLDIDTSTAHRLRVHDGQRYTVPGTAYRPEVYDDGTAYRSEMYGGTAYRSEVYVGTALSLPIRGICRYRSKVILGTAYRPEVYGGTAYL